MRRLRNPLAFVVGTNATGEGGTCLGDSGSPSLLNVDGTDVAVAVESLNGDQVCMSHRVNYRLDTPSARAFLGEFVTLP